MTYDPSVIDRRPRSMAHQFLERVATTPDEVAFYYPVHDSWQQSTWAEAHELVEMLAAGLIGIGVRPEERVAILAGTRYEWILCDLAIMYAGAATTTIYPTTVDADVAHILEDSGARVVIAEDLDQIRKLWRIRGRIRGVTRVIQIDGDFADDRVLSLEGLLRLGDQLLRDDPEVVARRLDAVRREGLATIMYTSGTTGTPKGVRLRHSSWTYQGAAVAALGILNADDLQLLCLPLAHAFGRLLLSAQLACGFPTAVDGRADRLADNLAVVRPTFLAAAPRLLERVHARIVAAIDEEGGLRRRTFDRAFDVARQVRAYEVEGRRVPFLLARRLQVLDGLVFAGIREHFGDRLRFLVLGVDDLDPEIAEFFALAGVTVLGGYGLTESSGGAFLTVPGDPPVGRLGRVLPGTDVQIAPDGEVLLSGPGVMDGYHNLPEQTAAVLSHGWLRTGDLGELDAEGRLRITGRRTDLFTTSYGKPVAPSHVEGALNMVCPYASEVVVVGADRPYCVAVIVLDPEVIGEWAEQRGLSASYAELVRSVEVHDLVGRCVDRLNAALNSWEQVRRFAIADEDLAIGSGELTPSLKVRRRAVEERYADRIRALYLPEVVTVRDLAHLDDAPPASNLAG